VFFFFFPVANTRIFSFAQQLQPSQICFQCYAHFSKFFHPASIKWILGGSFPEVKQPEHETDLSVPSSADIKNTGSYSSTFPYVFTVWCLIKHRTRLNDVVFSSAQGQLYRLLKNTTHFGIRD